MLLNDFQEVVNDLNRIKLNRQAVAWRFFICKGFEKNIIFVIDTL